jgi:polysaccharide deacetylase family protein (PEP-CTERM system associated)
MTNILSIDVEDYFHPSEVQAAIGSGGWDEHPSRVADATRRLLELLARHNVRGTFFVLGWVAGRHPRLVEEIARAGHEIACHSYAHQLVYDQTPAQFKNDTLEAVKVIEDACGERPKCYRAPSYSVIRSSLWAIEVLAECGFTHDSSIYPIHHDRYGIPDFPRHARRMDTRSGPIIEVPVATVRLGTGRVAPVGGGGYMRLLPYRYTAAGIRRINREDRQPACIYLHPWEVDPDQPRLIRGWVGRLRTYTGLSGMANKLTRLLQEFSFAPLTEVHPVHQFL